MAFNGKSTALEVIAGHDLSGYETIVTGGASGIGVETVRALATAGARVIIATRNLANAEAVAATLRRETGKENIEAEKLDIASLKSVREFVASYLAKGRPLHILINNAGIMACPKALTEDGLESQFGTNHIGHFALACGLMPALVAGTKQSGRNSRVVSLTSTAHAISGVLFDDVNFETTPYNEWVSYGQSKTANVLFSVGLTKRFGAQGVFSNAVMPGGIMTGLQKNLSQEDMIKRGWIDAEGKINDRFKSVAQGAATSIWAAVAAELDGRGGLYLEDCAIAAQRKDAAEVRQLMNGFVGSAIDETDAEKLWTLSEHLIQKK